MSDKFDWDAMTDEERRAFIADVAEESHRREYEAALKWARRPGPAWDDLTEEQRARIRTENDRYRQEMHEFGNALRAPS